MAGVIGSFFTASSIPSWYMTLNKPSFNPPNSVFAPVWISLYTLMGCSLYLIWTEKRTKKTKNAINWFYAQLVLNTVWSIAFFGLKDIFLGLVIILALIAVLAITMIKFYRINKNSFGLLVPYFLWCCFAAILNYNLWVLN